LADCIIFAPAGGQRFSRKRTGFFSCLLWIASHFVLAMTVFSTFRPYPVQVLPVLLAQECL
jgi:hypothetical protein